MKLNRRKLNLFFYIFLGAFLSLFFVNMGPIISSQTSPTIDKSFLIADGISKVTITCRGPSGTNFYSIRSSERNTCIKKPNNSNVFICSFPDWNSVNNLTSEALKKTSIACVGRNKLIPFISQNENILLSSKFILNQEADWLNSLSVTVTSQRERFLTLALSSDKLAIQPYFANLAAISLGVTNFNRYKNTIDGQIIWYLNHLNKVNNGDVLVYDYNLNRNSDGTYQEISTSKADSVDSYHATFLSLLAIKALNDPQGTSQLFLEQKNKVNLNLIISSLKLLQVPQKNYFIAKSDYTMPFTMDNAEVYKGLNDLCGIRNIIPTITTTENFDWACQMSNLMHSTFDNNFYNSNNSSYKIAIGNLGGVNSIYPEITANLWPILCDIKTTNTVAQWNLFKQQNPALFADWQNDQLKTDSFPHVSLARVAIKQKDLDTSRIFLNSIYNNRVRTNLRKWPWHVGEAANLLHSLNGI